MRPVLTIRPAVLRAKRRQKCENADGVGEESIVHRDHTTNYYSLEMLTSHQGTITFVFRVILVKVDYRGRKQGEEDTETDDDDVTNTGRKWRSTTKVGFLTLKLRTVSP